MGLMKKRVYNKKPLSFAEQLQQLKDRNLTVTDEASALHYLAQISYYRLSAYFLPYQKVKDRFDDGTTFNQIVDTYSFDRELRLLVFDCIERIEVAIRTQFIYCMAMHYGDSHWQDNQSLFIKPYYNKVGNLIDPYSDFQAIISRAKTARRPEVFIKHYIDNYHSPSNPPSWMCFELLTIGELSNLYRGLGNKDDRKRIAAQFDLHETVFTSWLHSLTYVRNICAHHSRFWNKDLSVEPAQLLKPVGPWVSERYSRNNKRTFYLLCVLKYLLSRVNPQNSLKEKLKELFKNIQLFLFSTSAYRQIRKVSYWIGHKKPCGAKILISMKELDLQDKYLINFLCERPDGLRYKEAKANTVSPQFFIVEDIKHFISETDLNKNNYKRLLKKFPSEKDLLNAFTMFLDEKIKSSMNMAIFINSNKSVTFEGVKLHLFYPSGSEFEEDKLFEQNIFSVVQELPYSFKYEGKQYFSFRPDLSFFLNGIFLGYSELKSNWNNQTSMKNGRMKVVKDYLNAVQEYLTIADKNDLSQTIRKDFLKIFEKAIHITSTDIAETYVIRNISNHFDEIKNTVLNGSYDFEQYEKKVLKDFKPYPLKNREASKTERFEEVFKALYDKKMIEKEILYYNFIERELIKKEGSKTKEYKHNDGRLISPRPKQKFGTDKILAKINEFLEHEDEPDYFIKKLEAELRAKGIGEGQIKELIAKRQKYQNNKTVYSLLMQYAAGFGKSNIIGWTALQLKDLRKNGEYVYDKVMLVVDRLQLRDQLDSKLHNMNIQKGMFIEATDKKSFITALSSDKRIVVVNLQKFTSVDNILDESVVKKLSKMRIAFLIDEIQEATVVCNMKKW